MTGTPHIKLPELPGILGLMAFRPETALPLNQLADALLQGPSPLSRGDRELIAAYVSNLNSCQFCQLSHSAFAAVQLEGGLDLVDAVKADPASAPVSDKLRALLAIAAKVQAGGKSVSAADVEAARAQGADDVEIHDTVLIAAAFCMFNRYVDGLATLSPDDQSMYMPIAATIAEHGYVGGVGVIAERAR